MRAALLLLVFAGGFAEGLRAYREGRFAAAQEAFARAEAEAGLEAGPELLFNRALAALQAGELRVAEYSAEKAAARGSAEFSALRDFLLGNAAFARCARAEAEARLPEADPTAYDLAILRAAEAGAFWQRAALSRADWPEARRNAERAQLKLAGLRRLKAEAERKRRLQQEQQPAPRPEPPPGDPDAGPREEIEQTLRPQPEPGAFSPAEMQRLVERLERMEREKRELRQASRRARSAAVEKDW